MIEEYAKKILERMEALEDGLRQLINVCGEIPAKDVGQDFHKAFRAASNALSGTDWTDGTFVPRFGTCPLPLNTEMTVTECIRSGNCGCNEKSCRGDV